MNEQDKAAFDEQFSHHLGFAQYDWAQVGFKAGCEHRDKQTAQAEPVGEVAQTDPLPEGWKATNAGPCDYLTEEANKEHRIYVERTLPPFEGKDRLRTWSGPDLYSALKKAHESLGISYESKAVAPVQQEPVHFRAVICKEQQEQALGVVPKIVGFVDKKAAEQFILEKRDFKGWKYNLEPLYTEAPAVSVNEQLLKALRDVTAHLIGAHSILKDGGKQSVASNRIFEVTLNDYKKSFEFGRAAIAAAEKSLTVTNRIEAESAIEADEVIEADEAAKGGV